MYIIVDSMLAGAALESERNLIWYELGHYGSTVIVVGGPTLPSPRSEH